MTTEPFVAAAHAERCPHCQKPLPLCLCATVQPFQHRLTVVILQHPQEKHELLGTGLLTHFQLPNSVLKIGLSWASLSAILGREVEMRRWAVLHLGSAKSFPAEARRSDAPEVLLLDRKGALVPAADQQAVFAALQGVIVLDGTWDQAKTLWWRNPWLLKARRLILNPRRRSAYGKLRREPRRESLSTLESAALCLSWLDKNPALFDLLVAPFVQFAARVEGK